jgi:serine/threonine protein kinase
MINENFYYKDQKMLQKICEIKKIIAIGGFGRVYLVKHHKYGEVVAKVIKASDYDPREFDNLEKFVGSPCENIVRILGF